VEQIEFGRFRHLNKASAGVWPKQLAVVKAGRCALNAMPRIHRKADYGKSNSMVSLITGLFDDERPEQAFPYGKNFRNLCETIRPEDRKNMESKLRVSCRMPFIDPERFMIFPDAKRSSTM